METALAGPLQIRAHHLLCLQGFQGYGYNQGFVSNMERIAARFKNDPESAIEVIADSDILCSPCPHHKNGRCHKTPDADRKVKSMDAEILKRLNLQEHSVMRMGTALALIGQRLQKKSDLAGICGECGWRPQCLWYESRRDG